MKPIIWTAMGAGVLSLAAATAEVRAAGNSEAILRGALDRAHGMVNSGSYRTETGVAGLALAAAGPLRLAAGRSPVFGNYEGRSMSSPLCSLVVGELRAVFGTAGLQVIQGFCRGSSGTMGESSPFITYSGVRRTSGNFEGREMSRQECRMVVAEAKAALGAAGFNVPVDSCQEQIGGTHIPKLVFFAR